MHVCMHGLAPTKPAGVCSPAHRRHVHPRPPPACAAARAWSRPSSNTAAAGRPWGGAQKQCSCCWAGLWRAASCPLPTQWCITPHTGGRSLWPPASSADCCTLLLESAPYVVIESSVVTRLVVFRYLKTFEDLKRNHQSGAVPISDDHSRSQLTACSHAAAL